MQPGWTVSRPPRRPRRPAGGEHAAENRLPGHRDADGRRFHRWHERAARLRPAPRALRVRAPSTPGSFLRAFSHGNVRQLDAVHRRLLAGLAARAPLLPGKDVLAYPGIDACPRRVYGVTKQGAAFGATCRCPKSPARMSELGCAQVALSALPLRRRVLVVGPRRGVSALTLSHRSFGVRRLDQRGVSRMTRAPAAQAR